MPWFECEVCGRELGFIVGSDYEESYCKECWEQGQERHRVWIKKHPAEAYASAQTALDLLCPDTSGGLVIRDILSAVDQI